MSDDRTRREQSVNGRRIILNYSPNASVSGEKWEKGSNKSCAVRAVIKQNGVR